MFKKKKSYGLFSPDEKNTLIKNAGSCFPIKLLKDRAEFTLPAVEATDAGLLSVPARAWSFFSIISWKLQKGRLELKFLPVDSVCFEIGIYFLQWGRHSRRSLETRSVFWRKENLLNAAYVEIKALRIFMKTTCDWQMMFTEFALWYVGENICNIDEIVVAIKSSPLESFVWVA